MADKPAIDLDALIRRISERLYALDASGLRVYNPDGRRIPSVPALLEARSRGLS